MDENKFWEILDINKKYLYGNLFHGHDYLVYVCGSLVDFSKEDFVKFLAIFDSKMYSLFSKKHLEVFKILELSHNLEVSEEDGIFFELNNDNTEYNSKYDTRFHYDSLRIRYNIITAGLEIYTSILTQPAQIIKHADLLTSHQEDNFFRIREYAYKMKDLGYRNYGSFEKELENNDFYPRVIKYGNYYENMEIMKETLKDFSFLVHEKNVETKLTEEEFKLFIIANKIGLNYYN